MQASSITHNIIKTSKNNNINKDSNIHILSDSSSSLFDNYLSTIEGCLFFPISSNQNHDYSVSYDIVMSNNPIAFSSSLDSVIGLHLNSIIYFHSKCPNNFKKEDKFLLRNSITQSFKIFPNETIMNSWNFPLEEKAIVLPYGINPPSELCNKTRSIVVLNTNNNPSVNILFQYIINVFKDAIIINDHRDSKAYQAIRESAICIEAESAFNVLTALSHGCYVLSGIDYIKEQGLFFIESYNEIIKTIHGLLESYNSQDANKYQNNILQKYPNINFRESFIKTIAKAKTEPYLYAKNN